MRPRGVNPAARRPAWRRRPWLLLPSALLLLRIGVANTVSGCASHRPTAAAAVPATAPVTVYFVRHAEKATDNPIDPGLSAAGIERARDLAELLADAPVTHLFATEWRRTQATLQPLAERTGLAIAVIEAEDPAAHVRALRALPAGSVAVVAGHSNTLPGLVQLLGGELPNLTMTERGPWLGDDEYDRLFVVSLEPGTDLRVVERRYGAPRASP